MPQEDPPLWQISASIDTLRKRAQLYTSIRHFFADRNVLEVETPLLSRSAATDVNIDSFRTQYFPTMGGEPQSLYLTTSPEFAMKRLLSAGIGPIFQICKSFRQGECGDLHNPEFTLLEWYQPGYDMRRLIEEVGDLLCFLIQNKKLSSLSLQASLKLSIQGVQSLTYQQVFENKLAINPHSVSVSELQDLAQQYGLNSAKNIVHKDDLLDFLMSHVVQPELGNEGLCFVTHYPATQASLAKLDEQNPLRALRFELFLKGIELANGFEELTDAQLQRQRFKQDLLKRKQQNKHLPPYDKHLISAMNSGLPACSGVAIGLDRLFLLLQNGKKLHKTLAFPINRA